MADIFTCSVTGQEVLQALRSASDAFEMFPVTCLPGKRWERRYRLVAYRDRLCSHAILHVLRVLSFVRARTFPRIRDDTDAIWNDRASSRASS